MMTILTAADRMAAGRPTPGPDAYDSASLMEERATRVLQALIRGGYVTSVVAAQEMQDALNEKTPYALLHLCDVLLLRDARAALAIREGQPADTPTEDDLARVRTQRDRATQGGGTWQAWDRILDWMTRARGAQAGVAEPGGRGGCR